MSNLWGRIKMFFQDARKRNVFLIVSGVILLLIFGTIAAANVLRQEKDVKKSLTKTITGKLFQPKIAEKTTAPSILTGEEVDKNLANRRPLAVIIENHTDARPQAGLAQAQIIYETIAEGGITRFMAIFSGKDADKVGPVRSARTFFLDWGLEYDAPLAHVGGNIDALDLIPQIGVKDLDQFRYGTRAYWREPQTGKASEHTMFTSTKKLYDIVKENGWEAINLAKIETKDEATPPTRPTSQKITIPFSSSNYEVVWNYDSGTNSYQRTMAGAPHKDALTNDQLSAKNIIVQTVNRQVTLTRINESGWKMTTIGTGKAVIFQDGQKIETVWKKPGQKDRTRFYDNAGSEIKLNKGNIWYEIIPPEVNIIIE